MTVEGVQNTSQSAKEKVPITDQVADRSSNGNSNNGETAELKALKEELHLVKGKLAAQELTMKSTDAKLD